MTNVRTIARDERGIALVVALVTLLTLSALVLAFLAMSAFEPQISANLAAGTQARYVAEAGVEAAFDGLALTPNWNDALVGATCSTGALAPNTTANMAVAGMTAASGTFTVRVRNDCFTGSATVSADNVLTGVALEAAGNANTDGNSRLIITSVGAVGNATRTIKVVMRKLQLPTINAALAFPGLNADVDFSGSAFTIRGIDTAMGSETTNGSGNPVLGISVGVAANENLVDTALANNQQNSVTGLSQTIPGTTAVGSSTVGFDTQLTSSAVTDFVNALKGSADVKIDATAGDFNIQNVGSTCSSNVNDAACWGTNAHPKVVYVKGNSLGSGVDISGSSSAGTGILIVENGTLDITGNFQWNGPIIVTGTGVKVRYHGGGNQSIWGSVIVNELANDGSTNLEADIAGNAKMFYSTEAINTVMNGLGGRRMMSLYSWQEQ
jgi:Tfp pilus assembly protein PilX